MSGAIETSGFIVLSLVADAAVVGLLAGVAMWCCARLRPRACALAAFLAGTAPLVAADVVSYELVRYFGDLVDIPLMFELTGRSLREVLAVSAGYLVVPSLAALAGVTACAGIVWLVDRRERGTAAGRPALATIAIPLAVFGAALVITGTATASHERIENGILRKPSGRVLMVLANELTDFDGDGFGMVGRLTDPDPSTAQTFPYAVDLPGNGIDEDGVGGDLPADAVPYREPDVTGTWVRRPDVVIIVLESFRFDLLGTTFEGRPATPVLDRLAARGVSSRRAYSHNGYTAQSRYHLLSGSLAEVRGSTTLIDDFKTNGYFVAYISGQDESFGGERYAAGFARADIAVDARSDRARRYTTFTTAGSLAVPFGVVEEHVTNVLESRAPAGQPLFLYVNFHDTHFPYSHDGVATMTSDVRVPRQGIVPSARDEVWAAYVNTAANVDAAVGRVLDQVRRSRGVEPAVIVTADHGESLFEDGFLGHGHALNDVQTRVPFIAANLPLIVAEPFGHADLRDGLATALRVPPVHPPVPQIRDGGHEVFQYLGTITRPRQIAIRNSAGAVIYDFRRGRVHLRGGPWRRPSELSETERVEFLRVVHLWERMMLARDARHHE